MRTVARDERSIGKLKQKNSLSHIHPSICQNSYPVAAELEPIPADIGKEAGYTLDWSPVNHIHSCGQFKGILLTFLHNFGVLAQPAQGQHLTPTREGLQWIRSQNLFAVRQHC